MVLLDHNFTTLGDNKSLHETSLGIQTADPHSSRNNFWNSNTICYTNRTSFPRLCILLGSLAQRCWNFIYGALLTACLWWNFCTFNEESCQYGLEDIVAFEFSIYSQVLWLLYYICSLIDYYHWNH